MREHGGETGHRAGGAAMGQLTLNHLRHAALLQHDEDASLRFWQWTAIEVDELRRVETKRAEIDAIFVDRGAVTLHLIDQGEQRTAESDDIGEGATAQHTRAHLKKVFSGGVDIVNLEPLPDHQQRMRKCV